MGTFVSRDIQFVEYDFSLNASLFLSDQEEPMVDYYQLHNNNSMPPVTQQAAETTLLFQFIRIYSNNEEGIEPNSNNFGGDLKPIDDPNIVDNLAPPLQPNFDSHSTSIH